MKNDAQIRIHDMLMAWGRNRAISDPPNDFPNQTAFARLIRNPGSANLSIAPLDEDEVQRIDREISSLRVKKERHWQVICLAYIEQLTDKRVGRRLRMSRSAARAIRQQAEHYLEAKLE